MITRINRDNIGAVREKMQIALNAVGTELGIKIVLGSIRFDAFGFSFKGTSKVVGTDPVVTAKQEWDEKCRWFGLTPDDYGKVFYADGVGYRLCGFKSGKSKYPVHATRLSDGKTYRFTSWTIREKLNRHPIVTVTRLSPLSDVTTDNARG